MQDVLVAKGLDTYKPLLPMTLYLLFLFCLIFFKQVDSEMSLIMLNFFKIVNTCEHAHVCTLSMKRDY